MTTSQISERAYPFNEALEVRASDIVLDTNVLTDLLFAERPGHALAVELSALLHATGTRALMPIHVVFEFISAVACERRRHGAPLTLVGRRQNLIPFEIALVVLDLQFLDECLLAPMRAGTLIDVSGGDMIFAAIALRYQLMLVSSDKELRQKASDKGIVALDVSDYMARARGE